MSYKLNPENKALPFHKLYTQIFILRKYIITHGAGVPWLLAFLLHILVGSEQVVEHVNKEPFVDTFIPSYLTLLLTSYCGHIA